MTEETLRQWAAGELPASGERDVYRWMVACTSPDLPELLHGLLRERKERLADQRLSARGSLWSSLVERWHTLLEAGAAAWMDPGDGLVLASADTPPTRPWAWIGEEDGRAALMVGQGPGQVAAYVVTDEPMLVRLLGPQVPPTGPVAISDFAGRPTVWVFRGTELAIAADAEAELAAHLRRSDLDALALRWKE